MIPFWLVIALKIAPSLLDPESYMGHIYGKIASVGIFHHMIACYPRETKTESSNVSLLGKMSLVLM